MRTAASALPRESRSTVKGIYVAATTILAAIRGRRFQPHCRPRVVAAFPTVATTTGPASEAPLPPSPPPSLPLPLLLVLEVAFERPFLLDEFARRDPPLVPLSPSALEPPPP